MFLLTCFAALAFHMIIHKPQMDTSSDGCDVSEVQLILKSSLMTGLGRVEGEDAILGKKKLLEQNG